MNSVTLLAIFGVKILSIKIKEDVMSAEKFSEIQKILVVRKGNYLITRLMKITMNSYSGP